MRKVRFAAAWEVIIVVDESLPCIPSLNNSNRYIHTRASAKRGQLDDVCAEKRFNTEVLLIRQINVFFRLASLKISVDSINNQLPLLIKRQEVQERQLQAALKQKQLRRRPGRRCYKES